MRGSPDQPWLTLRLRALVGLGLVGVILPSGAGVYGISRVREDMQGRIHQGQVAAARSVAAEVATGFGSALDFVRAAARLPGLTAWVQKRDVPALLEVLRTIVSTTGLLRSLSVFDAAGQLLSHYPARTSPPPAELAAEPGPRLFPARPADGDAVVTVREPVLGARGEVLGSLVAEVSFSRTAPGARRLRYGHTGTATVVDREGQVLVTGGPGGAGRRLDAPELRRLVRRWEAGTASYRSPTAERRELAAFVPVEGFAWGVLVTQAEAEALAPVGRLTRILVLGLAGLVVAGLGTGLVVAQALGRYERRLRQELEEQARLNRALDAFSSRAAHDIRSPLGAISMAAELILQDPQASGSERTRRAVEIIHNQARHAIELVHDLLALARASETPKPEPIDLASLVADVAAQVDGVDVQLEQAPPQIVADPRALRQALVNLLDNAARYARGDGKAAVTVRCEQSPEGWRLQVADRGPGLPETDAPMLFEPFVRGQRGGGGTGLGLAIVAAMAQAHGGRAWYEPREGGGSVFCVFIPAPEARAGLRRPAGPDARSPSAAPA